ncbi:diaminobutyrate acetyltransferase [Stackebrandtia soli]|uniref:diaminobutyrate acetyltransferase n=1 Tax=Stackebrandtia soli TaxID=1892856 RepID=UPI0039EAA550
MPPGDTSASVTQASRETNLDLRPPSISDGNGMWTLASASGTLDVNSRYSYLLWCRDFADTSVIVTDGGDYAGFLTGYRRPDSPDTFFVWQIAVADSHRRRGLARRMLDHVVARDGANPRFVEATVTPDNIPSTRLFESFADANDCPMRRDELFSERALGDGHEPEILFRIGPLHDHT